MVDDTVREAVEAAVRQAETRTSGEIYCVAAEESSDYREVVLAWAGGVAILGPALLLLGGVEVSAPDVIGGWTAAQVGAAAQTAARQALIGAVMLQGVLFALTAIVTALPPVRLRVTPGWLKREQVRRRAAEQFLAKNLQGTRARTGVLIYVSMKEHMAEILVDEGIAAKVAPQAWEGPMQALVEGLKRGAPAEGFTAAIARCADLLAEPFPADPSDNPNELPDALVVLPKT